MAGRRAHHFIRCVARLAAVQEVQPVSTGGKGGQSGTASHSPLPEDDEFALTPTSPEARIGDTDGDGTRSWLEDMVVPSTARASTLEEESRPSAALEHETCALCGADLGGKNIAERLAHGDECFERMQLLEESRSYGGCASPGSHQSSAARSSPAGLLNLVEESDDEDFKDSSSTPSQHSDRSGSDVGVCPICTKILTYRSEQRRSQHVSRCIEEQEKKERDAEEDDPTPVTSSKGKGKRKKRFTPQTARLRHSCTACDQDLTSMNQAERIKHYKRCHAQRGTRLQVLQQVRGIKDGVRHVSTGREFKEEEKKTDSSPGAPNNGVTNGAEDGSVLAGGSTQEEHLTSLKESARRVREAATDEGKETKLRVDVDINSKLASVTGGRVYTRSVRKLPTPQPLPKESDDSEKGPAGFSVPLTPQEKEDKRKQALEVMFDATQHSPRAPESPGRAREGRLTAFSESRLASSAARAPRSLWKMSTATIDISIPEECASDQADSIEEDKETSKSISPYGSNSDKSSSHSDVAGVSLCQEEVMARMQAIIQSYNDECARLHEQYVINIGKAAIERDMLLRELRLAGSTCSPLEALNVPQHPRPPEVLTPPVVASTKSVKRARSEPSHPREAATGRPKEAEKKRRKLSLFSASEHSSGAAAHSPRACHEMELLSPTPQSGSSI